MKKDCKENENQSINANKNIRENECLKECRVSTRKGILKKAAQVGASSMLSKIFGMVRDLMLANFLGVGVMSDAFIIAFKLPNSLRKIFAEGAMSASMVPSVVETIRKKGVHAINKLMSLAFLVFEGALIAICFWAMWKASFVIKLCAPGFSPEKTVFCAKLLQIMMPFVFFISSSALLAGPLQAIGRFFVPAISQVLINLVFIAGMVICAFFGWKIEVYCFFVLFAGLLQFIMHIFAYLKAGFSFEKYDNETKQSFWHVMRKFFPCLFSMSVVELAMFIDTSFGSYLPDGSVSLIHYAERFMGIPISVFGVAFSTILLPHFSKLTMYAPSRIKFYLLEAAKFIFWVAIPAILMMMFFSENIFSTLFAKKFTTLQIQEAGAILTAYLFGVFFFSLNKILLNVFYSFHSMWIPTLISIIGTATNFCMNMLFIRFFAYFGLSFASVGLAVATTVSATVQTILYIVLMNKFFGVKFYLGKFFEFLLKYCAQLGIILTAMYFVYNIFYKLISVFIPKFAPFFLLKIGFWMWVGPLVLITYALIYFTRKIFKVRLFFID